jgi:hypothetical protein
MINMCVAIAEKGQKTVKAIDAIAGAAAIALKL